MGTPIANYDLVEQTLNFIPRMRYIGKRYWSWRVGIDRRTSLVRGD